MGGGGCHHTFINAEERIISQVTGSFYSKEDEQTDVNCRRLTKQFGCSSLAKGPFFSPSSHLLRNEIAFHLGAQISYVFPKGKNNCYHLEDQTTLPCSLWDKTLLLYFPVMSELGLLDHTPLAQRISSLAHQPCPDLVL